MPKLVGFWRGAWISVSAETNPDRPIRIGFWLERSDPDRNVSVSAGSDRNGRSQHRFPHEHRWLGGGGLAGSPAVEDAGEAAGAENPGPFNHPDAGGLAGGSAEKTPASISRAPPAAPCFPANTKKPRIVRRICLTVRSGAIVVWNADYFCSGQLTNGSANGQGVLV